MMGGWWLLQAGQGSSHLLVGGGDGRFHLLEFSDGGNVGWLTGGRQHFFDSFGFEVEEA